LAAASAPGWRGCAVAFVCHEPACTTLFESASPTFKLRFMYMAGHEDEEAFDRFARGFDLTGVGAALECPYLVIAGERDELSPIEHTHRLLAELRGPRELLLYEGERHGLHSSSSSRLGPDFADHAADWLLRRLDGVPARSRQLYVEATGAVTETAWEEAPRDPVADPAD
jgi:pimeloyl-ACP methyl ester carboxylesterase